MCLGCLVANNPFSSLKVWFPSWVPVLVVFTILKILSKGYPVCNLVLMRNKFAALHCSYLFIYLFIYFLFIITIFFFFFFFLVLCDLRVHYNLSLSKSMQEDVSSIASHCYSITVLIKPSFVVVVFFFFFFFFFFCLSFFLLLLLCLVCLL